MYIWEGFSVKATVRNKFMQMTYKPLKQKASKGGLKDHFAGIEQQLAQAFEPGKSGGKGAKGDDKDADKGDTDKDKDEN